MCRVDEGIANFLVGRTEVATTTSTRAQGKQEEINNNTYVQSYC
jgi:hypothetical protein